MATKQFAREYLMEELDLPYAAVENTVVDNSRWSVYHEIIFQDKDGKHYRTCYSVGATECQDEGPWDYEPIVECEEVEQREVKVMAWVPVESGEEQRK